MNGVSKLVAQLKDPEYTGENRCIPCTIVNTGIAGVLSLAGAYLASRSEDRSESGLGVGIVVLAVSLAAIYLKGYLVPGTPTLTKRHLPDWVLDAFGKAPTTDYAEAVARERDAAETAQSTASTDETVATDDDGEEGEAVEDLDVEETLVAAGTLEVCRDGQDLCLTEEFERRWLDSIDAVRAADAGRERLLDVLDVESAEVEFSEYGDAFQAQADGHYVGTWESEAAFIADAAAADALEDRVGEWDALNPKQRGELCNGLRLFLETCPSCDGDLSFGTNTVESCCRSTEVAAVTCEDCGARLFESPVDE